MNESLEIYGKALAEIKKLEGYQELLEHAQLRPKVKQEVRDRSQPCDPTT